MTEQTELLLRVSGTAIVSLLMIAAVAGQASSTLPSKHRFFNLAKLTWQWCLRIVVVIVVAWIFFSILNFVWTADSKTFK